MEKMKPWSDIQVKDLGLDVKHMNTEDPSVVNATGFPKTHIYPALTQPSLEAGNLSPLGVGGLPKLCGPALPAHLFKIG